MIYLIKEWLELWAKQYWLKHIDRAADKYNRLKRKAIVQANIVHKLVERYNEIYPGDKIVTGKKDGERQYEQNRH